MVGGSPVTQGELLKRFFESQPPGSKRDLAFVEQSQKIRNMLRSYWTSVRQAAPDHMQDMAVSHLLSMDLSPEYNDALESEWEAVRKEIQDRAQVQPVVSWPNSESPQPADTPPRPAGSAKSKKNKAKSNQAGAMPASDSAGDLTSDGSRPAAKQDSKPQSASNILPDAELRGLTLAEPTIPATKRALEVFSKMYAADAEDAAKGVEWDVLVHAMKDIGFNVQNGAGSAVQFELPDKGKIVFHRPHPAPKVDSVMLKAMGRRMKKWFGFSRQRFTPIQA